MCRDQLWQWQVGVTCGIGILLRGNLKAHRGLYYSSFMIPDSGASLANTEATGLRPSPTRPLRW